jgi:hypothetical protein
MREHWSFNAASWTYFSIAALFLLVVLWPFFVAQPASRFAGASAATIVVASSLLGLWSRRIYLNKRPVSKALFLASMVAFALLGSLSSGFWLYVVFAVPSLFIATAMKAIELRRQKN